MSKQKLSDVKRAYAAMVLSKAPAGNKNTVVVLPEFMENENGEWVPTDECVIASGGTKGFGYISLIQRKTVFAKRAEFDNDLFALHTGRKSSLEAKYRPGMLLPGHIVTEDSLIAPNPSNVEQDLKYISAAAREASVPCMLDDQPIYQQKYWEPTGTVQDTIIPHNNDIVAQVQSQAPTANSGMDEAKIKAAKIAELSAIPANKRTKEQKEELASLI